MFYLGNVDIKTICAFLSSDMPRSLPKGPGDKATQMTQHDTLHEMNESEDLECIEHDTFYTKPPKLMPSSRYMYKPLIQNVSLINAVIAQCHTRQWFSWCCIVPIPHAGRDRGRLDLWAGLLIQPPCYH